MAKLTLYNYLIWSEKQHVVDFNMLREMDMTIDSYGRIWERDDNDNYIIGGVSICKNEKINEYIIDLYNGNSCVGFSLIDDEDDPDWNDIVHRLIADTIPNVKDLNRLITLIQRDALNFSENYRIHLRNMKRCFMEPILFYGRSKPFHECKGRTEILKNSVIQILFDHEIGCNINEWYANIYESEADRLDAYELVKNSIVM